MTSIGSRVRVAMSDAGMRQKDLAERVGMTPDALSRALNDQRGFAAVELADIAGVLEANLHTLITGEEDPHRLVLSARHTYHHASGDRRVDGLEDDHQVLEDIRLAYSQSGAHGSGPALPTDVDDMRRLLHPDFVRRFIDHLAEIGVDVVRISGLSTAYSLVLEERPVIVLPESGNWFFENWSLAHELGHLALGHEGVVIGSTDVDAKEQEANAFAAELLLPEARLLDLDWSAMDRASVAELVWTWGVSTEALRRRLNALDRELAPEVAEVLTWTTQKLLRRHWTGARIGDPISRRMEEAATRHFPVWLQEAHLARIAEGTLGKGTLAWMLDVPAESLEVEEPPKAVEISDEALDAIIG